MYTIDDIPEGNWLVFYLGTGKKCLGKISLQIFVDDEGNFIKEELVHYLDETGLPGTIRKEEIPKDFSVINVAMEEFFDNKKLYNKPRKSLKTLIFKIENQN